MEGFPLSTLSNGALPAEGRAPFFLFEERDDYDKRNSGSY